MPETSQSLRRPNPLPRELAPGVHWLGECLELSYRGQVYHSYDSAFLVVGSERSVLVEAGHPQDLEVIAAQIDGIVEAGAAPLTHIFATHQETPHASGVGFLLDRYPETVVCGNVNDYHLVFPQYAERFQDLPQGAALELGDSRLMCVEAVFRDYIGTRWAYDTSRQALFTGDGFAYSHYHQDGHCGRVAEEAESLDVPDMTALFAELAFNWTRYVDVRPYIERLDALVEELDVRLIAPTHGLPITDPARTLPKVREGLLAGSASSDQGGVG